MKNKRSYVIAELYALGIYENMKNQPLDALEYRELQYLLAVKRAVAS